MIPRPTEGTLSEGAFTVTRKADRLPGGALRLTASAVAREDARLGSLTLFEAPIASLLPPSDDLRFFRDWHYVWDRTGTRPLSGPLRPDEPDSTEAMLFAALYSVHSGRAIGFGYRLPVASYARIELDVQAGSVRCVCRYDRDVPAGSRIDSDELHVVEAATLPEALAALQAPHVARRMNDDARRRFGWNSWDYYKLGVREEDILENARFLRETEGFGDRIRYITVDDGWEMRKGDWVPNERFPSGMESLAGRIRELGFLPGIWTSPLLPVQDSDLAREHSEWLLRRPDGPVRLAKCHLLDATHPEVREYVFDLYRRLHRWGYRYFKTDFLCYAVKPLVPGTDLYDPSIQLHDPGKGVFTGMRECMQAIRAAIGEDSYWVGCGTDLSSGAGIMDAARISGDIAPYWSRVEYQARSVIHHAYLHGRLFANDPDFLIVRGSDTTKEGGLEIPADTGLPYAPDAWRSDRCFSLEDARSWATLVILSGGAVNLSDRLSVLNEAGLSVIRTVLEHAGGEGLVPLDPEKPIPSVLFRADGQRRYLGFFNASHEETIDCLVPVSEWKRLPAAGRAFVRDLWRGEDVPVAVLTGTIPLGPHASRLFFWEEETPWPDDPT